MELKIKCINTTTGSDGSQYGKYVIEPMEKGFGTTVGNALRRGYIYQNRRYYSRIHFNSRYC